MHYFGERCSQIQTDTKRKRKLKNEPKKQKQKKRKHNTEPKLPLTSETKEDTTKESSEDGFSPDIQDDPEDNKQQFSKSLLGLTKAAGIRQKSKVIKRLRFLSKIYLKASRNSSCQSCLPKSDFSLRIATKQIKRQVTIFNF